MTLLDHALRYAYDGWPVFPCKLNKRPYTRHGFKDATTEVAQIRSWWGTWPQASIGVATGAKAGIWVLDIDGEAGRESLKALELVHGPLPDTLRVRTGGGGWHYYFKWPICGRVGNRTGVEPGLDVRGEGGYVIAPPSAHESGHSYRWELEGIDIDVSPEWLFDIAVPAKLSPSDEQKTKRDPIRNPRAYAAATIARACETIRGTGEGDRNATLNRVAFSLRDLIFSSYMSREKVELELQNAAEAAGLNAGESRNTIASGLGDAHGPVGQIAPRIGPEDPAVLPSAAPMRVAEHLAGQCLDIEGRLLLRRWRGDWYRYRDGCYRAFSAEILEAETWKILDGVFVPGKDGPTAYVPTISKVANVLRALHAVGTVIDETAEPPIWVGGDGELPRDVLVTRNGILDLATEQLRPLTPDLFSTCVVETPWDPTAGKPERWIAFLESLWPGNPDAQTLLQEFFGYCLVADTSQQKMLFVIGPKRSGKGTIARIMTAMLGRDNVAGPSLSGLATQFGLQSLIGRPVGIISDARLSGRADQGVIIERLLSITGEDSITVDRKNREPITVRLPTRLVMMSNELPRLSDASGALASRMLLLQLSESFYGRENTDLEPQLLEELTGILLWSVRGWQTLQARGRFLVPQSSKDAIEDLDELSSPISMFIEDSCVVANDQWISCQLLYSTWCDWAKTTGYDPGSIMVFSRGLKAAQSRIKTVRVRANGDRTRRFVGINTRTREGPVGTSFRAGLPS